MSVAFTAVLHLALAVSDAPYPEAIKNSEKSGKPVLVLIGADWCPYCKVVQRDVLPVMKERGLMDKVEYVYLDYDKDARQVFRLLKGEIIPEMIMVYKTADGWKKSHLSGGYKVAEIEGFIKENLKGAEADRPVSDVAKVPAKE